MEYNRKQSFLAEGFEKTFISNNLARIDLHMVRLTVKKRLVCIIAIDCTTIMEACIIIVQHSYSSRWACALSLDFVGNYSDHYNMKIFSKQEFQSQFFSKH